MNLMIVLVPVLLLSMVFTHIRIHDIQLPELSQKISEDEPDKELQLLIQAEGFEVQYPAGKPLKTFPLNADKQYEYAQLSRYLRDIKATFQEKNIEKDSITLLSSDTIPYQVLVKTLDSIKFSVEMVDGEKVNAELFPAVALGSVAL